MNKLGNLIGPVVAPWVTLAGRLFNSAKVLKFAERLDPLSFRPQLLRAATEGSLTTAPSRLLVAAKLALACQDSEGVISSEFSRSHGQLLQDIAALLANNCRKGGYFVEVGVGDGTNVSNTLLLERDYGWKGLLVEPNRDSHENIRSTRKAKLVTTAAYSRSGERVVFSSMPGLGELSGISTHLDGRRVAADLKTYEVVTETLDEILMQEGAPSGIDFMSIDTEGSELEILKGLSLDRWKVNFLAIEHNHLPGKINQLQSALEPLGYRRVLEHVSQFDAWFIHKSVDSRHIP